VIRRVTGELADLAEKTAEQAAAVLRNGRRALPKALSGRMRGRLRRALNELATTAERTATIVAQTRSRLAGQLPQSATRLVSLHDPDARPIRKGRIDRPVEFGYKAQVVDNDGVVLDYSVEYGAAPDGPQLAPAMQRVSGRTGRVPRAVTADRGYGQPAVERDLQALGVRTVAIPARPRSHLPARPSSTAGASASSSSGAPDRKGGSATSRTPTAGIAPGSIAKTERPSGAGTGLRPQPGQNRGPGQVTGTRQTTALPSTALTPGPKRQLRALFRSK
jgi:hypothetical protein